MTRQKAAESFEPRSGPVSREAWVAATVLGSLRTAVNDPIRAPKRDRRRRNTEVDLMGAIGELVAIRLASSWSPGSVVRHNLLDLWKSVDEVDLIQEVGGRSLGFESKAFFAEAKRDLFMINDTAWKKSRCRGAVGFIPVLTAPGADRAYAGRVIPIEQVGTWELRDFGYNDPARVRPLSLLLPEAFEETDWRHTIRELEQRADSALTRAERDQIRRGTPLLLDALRRDGIQLRDLPYEFLITGLNEMAMQAIAFET